MTAKETKTALRFDEGGLCGQLHKDMTPELCARLGRAAGALAPGKKLGLGCSGPGGARALGLALAGGAMSAGAQVLDFGECPRAVFDFCMAQSGAEAGFFIEGEHQISLSAVDKGGLPAARERERALEYQAMHVNGEAFPPPGSYTPAPGFVKRYPFALLTLAAVPLEGEGVSVRSSGKQVAGMMKDTFARLGCRPSLERSIQISADGTALSFYTPQTGYVFMDHLRAICCLGEFMRGADVAVEESSPWALTALARQYGRRVLRYSPAGEGDEGAKKLAEEQPFLRDGMMMAVYLLSFLKEHEVSLEEALRLIPDFYTVRRFVAVPPAGSHQYRDKQGQVTVKPVKSGKGVWVLAESEKAETAMELCDLYEDKLKKAALDTGEKSR